MKRISTFLLVTLATALLTGCTYAITMVHTEGTATDVVDADQKADADVSAEVPVRPF